MASNFFYYYFRRSHYEDIGRGYNTRDRGYERVINRASISPPRGMLPHVYDEKLDDRGLQKSVSVGNIIYSYFQLYVHNEKINKNNY